MNLEQDKVVLLFYKDFESDSFIRYDRYLKRMIRPIYYLFKKGQKVSGFHMWYQLLVKALRQEGYHVYQNDYAKARENPDYPVGIIGYPHILDDWSLLNPALLGPALFDHPQLAPNLMQDPRNKAYIVTCPWVKDLFEPYYPNACVLWHAGIDMSIWPDTKKHPKSIDLLIYDKIRWNREHFESALLNSIIEFLESQNLNHAVIRYKFYDHAHYQEMLSKSKAMIFLCEHETQGMAYQEALASNVPVLAWDNGFWLDPNRFQYESEPVVASSTPYFSPECGEKFKDMAEFPSAFDEFWSNLDKYQPRQYVGRELSLKGSAELYMKYYRAIASTHG